MNLEKVITQLEGKETLLIFLRDNFPDVLEKWKNKNAGVDETPADQTRDDADIPGVNQNDYRDK